MDNIEWLHGKIGDPRSHHDDSATTEEILAEWEDTWIGDMLDTPPPEREWVIDSLVPQETAVALAAGGGTGKSFLTLQMAFAIATGTPFLGFPISKPGSVLILNAEDDRKEIHRRVFAIANRARKDGEIDKHDEENVKNRLRVLSLVGKDNRLTAVNGKGVERTKFKDKLKRMVGDRDLRLIVIDPISRFRGGEENSNDHMTYFVEAAEAVRTELGTTVMLIHHFSKNGLRNGTSMSAADLRGGSALLDGVRCALAMATMSREMSAAYGVNPDEAKMYVRFDGVKANYGEPWPGMWLQRSDGGVLVKSDIQEIDPTEFRQDRKEKAQIAVTEKIVAAIREAYTRGYPHTQNTLLKMSGVDGQFCVSNKGMRALIKKAIDDGLIVEAPNTRSQGGGTALIPVGGDGPF